MKNVQIKIINISDMGTMTYISCIINDDIVSYNSFKKFHSYMKTRTRQRSVFS